MKKIYTFIIFAIFLMALVSGYEFRTRFNPFTGKLDFYTGENFTGQNITADSFTGDGSGLTGISAINLTVPTCTGDDVLTYNGTALNCVAQSGGNSTFNQTLTDGLYANISWNYNQTDTVFFYNQSDGDTQYTNGSGLSLIGTEFNHSDTSSQADSDNSGNTFIQDIILDTFGHITSLVTNVVQITNIFNQDLNTTNNVTFANLIVREDITLNGTAVLQFIYNMTDTQFFYNQTLTPLFYNQSLHQAPDNTIQVTEENITDLVHTAVYLFASDQDLNTTNNVTFTNMIIRQELNVNGTDVGQFLYNQTNLAVNSTFNQTLTDTLYALAGSGNATFNQTLTDTLYSGIGFNYNQTGLSTNNTFNQTLTDALYALAGSGNATFNQTLTDTLYTGIEFDYNQTFINGSGLSIIGFEINHSDTSSQADSDNSGNTFIQDIILDTFGHITSIVTGVVELNNLFDQDLNTTNNVTFTNLIIREEINLNGTDVGQFIYNQTDTVFFYNQSDGNTGAANIFDQDLNTTNNVTFKYLIVRDQITLNGTNILQFLYNQSLFVPDDSVLLNILNISNFDFNYNQSAVLTTINIFDQNLNSTENVTFVNTIIREDITLNGTAVLQFIYNQTDTIFFYNQTATVFFYNQTLAGDDIFVNQVGDTMTGNLTFGGTGDTTIYQNNTKVCLNGPACTSYIQHNGTATILT